MAKKSSGPGGGRDEWPIWKVRERGERYRHPYFSERGYTFFRQPGDGKILIFNPAGAFAGYMSGGRDDSGADVAEIFGLTKIE